MQQKAKDELNDAMNDLKEACESAVKEIGLEDGRWHRFYHMLNTKALSKKRFFPRYDDQSRQDADQPAIENNHRHPISTLLNDDQIGLRNRSLNNNARSLDKEKVLMDREGKIIFGHTIFSNNRESNYNWRKLQDKVDEGAGGGGVVFDGVWRWTLVRDNFLNTMGSFCTKAKLALRCCRKPDKEHAKTSAKSPTYAIVTFTSRKSAIEARQLIVDGRGGDNWTNLQALPVPPLADGAPRDIIGGCFEPVTFTINKNHALARKILVFLVLVLISIFSTYFFVLLESSLNKDQSNENVVLDEMTRSDLVGFIPGITQTLFLSLVPYILRWLSMCGSGATSLQEADGYALQYYWVFNLVIAFTGPALANMIINAVNTGDGSKYYYKMLTDVADTLPKQTSFVWINVMITRSLISLPVMYLLQFLPLICHIMRLRYFKLLLTGGMNGFEMPYQIHVDSAMAFLCTVSLSFVSPLISVTTTLYFLLAAPLHRWNTIFNYRQKYDYGGSRWPFIFEMYISSMIMGQFLLAISFLFKAAPGPALFAFMPSFFTLLFRQRCRGRYFKSFQDVGALQISRDDGWNEAEPTSIDKREAFRKFLVDTHKAAYVPVCIGGKMVNSLTLEHSSVVPLPYDQILEEYSTSLRQSRC